MVDGSDGVVTDTVVYDGRNDVTTATDPSTELNDLEGGSLYTYLVGAGAAVDTSNDALRSLSPASLSAPTK